MHQSRMDRLPCKLSTGWPRPCSASAHAQRMFSLFDWRGVGGGWLRPMLTSNWTELNSWSSWGFRPFRKIIIMFLHLFASSNYFWEDFAPNYFWEGPLFPWMFERNTGACPSFTKSGNEWSMSPMLNSLYSSVPSQPPLDWSIFALL